MKPAYLCLWFVLVCAVFAPSPAASAMSPAWAEDLGLRLSRWREPVFGSEVQLYAAGQKTAPAVVLVHGLGQRGAQDWDKLIPTLAADYYVIALDLPGFAHSEAANHLYRPDNYARVLNALHRRFIQRPFTLVGHSMGGAISLRYASTYPETLKQLLLVDVAGILHRSVYVPYLSALGVKGLTGFNPNRSSLFNRLGKAAMSWAEKLPDPSGLMLELGPLRQLALQGNPSAIAATALMDTNYSNDIYAFPVGLPVDLAWGEQDPVAPLRTGYVLAKNLPEVSLTVFKGLEHVPMQEAPSQFNDWVLTALNAPSANKVSPAQQRKEGTAANVSGCTVSPGNYEEVTIEGCSGARLTHVNANRLVISNSTVDMRSVTVANGVNASNSQLTITASRLSGPTAVEANHSSLDVAGSVFASTESSTPVVGIQNKIYWSVSRFESGGRQQYLHRFESQ